MYRRNSEDKSLDIDQESNPDPSRSNSPKNMKFYNEDKTVLNQQKKSFCIDALLSNKNIETEQTIQEKMAQQKYLALIQNKNYITRYQNENYDTQIEQNTIDKCQNRPGSGFDSPRSGRSSPRSASPGSDDGNRSECYSPPISPGVEGGSEEYDSYRPGEW